METNSSENYVEQCKAKGKERIEETVKSIEDMLGVDMELLNNCSVSVTGSDGRGENKDEITSDYEFIFLSNLDGDEREEKKGKILKVFSDYLKKEPLYEEKNLIKGDLAKYNRDPKRVFFERLIDTIPILGNETLISQSKKQLQEEILLELTGIRKKYVKRFKEYQNIIQKGGIANFKGDLIQHYKDYDSEIELFFDKENNAVSVKYSHLRVIQNSVLIRILDSFKDPQTQISLQEMPPNTIDKVKYLVDKAALNFTQEDISEVEEVYGYFLKLYHESAKHFYHTGQKQHIIAGDNVPYFRDATKSLIQAAQIIRE